MRPAIQASLALAGLVGFAGSALAEETALRSFACDDARTAGWNFYCDRAVEDEVLEAVPDDPLPPAPRPKSYSEQIAEYRAELDELKHKAILEPTPENVQNYMEAQAAMVRQAGLFTETWQRILFASPHLDANVDNPLSAMGTNLYQDRLDLERAAAFQTATTEAALMFVYEGSPSCLVCEAQGEVLAAMEAQYGLTVFPVSRDGEMIPAYPDSRVDRGQIANLGLSKIPSPFLALVEPVSGQVDLIGAGLMTQDVILDRVRIITSIPEGTLYE